MHDPVIHHNHLHDKNINNQKLLWATLLNFIITIVQIIGGLFSNSLALISDALHNLGDTFAVFIAYIANKISKRASNERKTFGYKRIEIIAAFINSGILVALSLYIFIEAIKRFYEPEIIKGQIMFIVAIIGLIANLISVLILKKDSLKNINVRAAYIHLMGDMLSSIAVIIGGLLILYFKVFWIDPLITILIALYITYEAGKIFRESLNILMQGTPENLNLSTIKGHIEGFDEVSNIHHLHAWTLNDDQIHFECHVNLTKDYRISDLESLHAKISNVLSETYLINHLTIQFEFDWCDNQDSIIDNSKDQIIKIKSFHR